MHSPLPQPLFTLPTVHTILAKTVKFVSYLGDRQGVNVFHARSNHGDGSPTGAVQPVLSNNATCMLCHALAALHSCTTPPVSVLSRPDNALLQ